MVDIRMCGEEFLQNVVIQHFFSKQQIQVDDFDVWKVVVHVMTESHFTVLLLLACHLIVLHLFHKHNLCFVRGNEHQHSSRKVTATEGVLPIKRQWFQVRHVGV